MGMFSLGTYKEKTVYWFLFFHAVVTWNVVSLTCPFSLPFPVLKKFSISTHLCKIICKVKTQAMTASLTLYLQDQECCISGFCTYENSI